MKKHIAVLSFVLLLLSATVVYAFSASCYSTITNGLITMRGCSVTAADCVCDKITAFNGFYKDGELVDSCIDEKSNHTWAQADVEASNSYGQQTWEIYGIHCIELSGYNPKTYTSEKTQNY